MNIDPPTESLIPTVQIPERSVYADSATESDGESNSAPIAEDKIKMPSPPPANQAGNDREPSSDSEPSPVRFPAKKKQKQFSSSSDDDQMPPGQARGGAAPKRGARQPIKRGGKRF